MVQNKKVLTLVYIRDDDDNVLLGLKKRGFGEGKWNGFGGKVHLNETILDGAIREVKEECNLDLQSEDVNYVGLIDFEFEKDPVHLEVHVFEARKFSGDVTESEEMAPQWWKINQMPYDKMWIDDEFWHPFWLRGEKFKAYFLYQGFETILKSEVTAVPDLSLQ